MVQVTIALEEKVKLDQQAAIRTLLDLSSKVKSRSGGRKWTREELHER
jgi:hypothetical protein